ncbi:MAG TPA: hypothetical protein VNO21_26765 [Polyangiaceae bacterium]|nr:hypothetical protein [Polyangiaceae bacterium]
MTARPGPSLAKTRGERLLRTRQASFVRASDGRFRDLLGSADVISEGATREESDGPVWYGSTSLIVTVPFEQPETRALFAEVAARDPHIRIRAIRIAKREASIRAGAPLGRASCELRISADARGLRIDVDLQAPLIEERRRGRMRGDHSI